MAATSAARDTKQMGILPLPQELNLPVAAATKINAGSMVGMNAAGYCVPLSSAAGLLALGRARANADNTSGAAGALRLDIDQGVFYYASGTGADLVSNVTSPGMDLYAIDDQTVGLTDGGQTRSFAGRCVPNPDTNLGIAVLMGIGVSSQDAGGAGPVVLTYDLADIANGSIGKITPKFAGRIKAVQAVAVKAASTAAKLATITPQIGPVGGAYTSITGGVLSLTSANMQPIGNEVDATAVTDANAFTAAQQINLLASAVTTFVEGRVAIILFLGK